MNENLAKSETEPKEESLGLYAAEIGRAKENWARIFDAHTNGKDRVQEILHRFEWIPNSELINGDQIRKDLENLFSKKSREEFVGGVMLALGPIIELSKNDPVTFEKIQRESQKSDGGNEALHWNLDENDAQIHLSAVKTLGISKIKKVVVGGLEELAKTIKENQQIKTINATSWIIYKNPKIIERLGFKIVKTNEERSEATASITREEFLKKYLKEK